jgi:G-patch domain
MSDFISFQQQPNRKGKGIKKFVKASSSFTELVDDYLENCDDFDELKLLKTTLQTNISDDSEDSNPSQENYFSKLMEGKDVENDDENWESDSESSDMSMNSADIIQSMQESNLDDLRGETDFIKQEKDLEEEEPYKDYQQLSIWTDGELSQAALELGTLEDKSVEQLQFLSELIQEIEERELDHQDFHFDNEGFKQAEGSTFWAKSINDPKRIEYEMQELEREMKYKNFTDSDDNSDDSDELDNNLSRAAKKREKKKIRREKRFKLQQQDSERKDLVKNLGDGLDKNRKTVGPELIQYLTTINTDLKKFCGDSGYGDIHILPPMPSAVRKLAIEICKAYNTSSKTRGSGKKKTVMVYRTGSTSVPENWKTLVQSVAGRGNLLQGVKPKALVKKGSVKVKTSDAGPKVGDIVGSKAAAIDDDNLGHKMMRMMGWSPGESLGKDKNGIVDPIKVVIRSKKAGLGQE